MSTHHTSRAASAGTALAASAAATAGGLGAGRCFVAHSLDHRPADRQGASAGREGWRPPVAATSLDLLDRSRGSLLLACRAGDCAERYLESHLGALRAAAALLAVRSTATGRSRPRSVWDVLPVVAPELSEWASFFAGSARRRVVIQRGGAPTPREADDLLRQAEVFLEIVQDLIGVPRAEPLPDYIAPATASGTTGTRANTTGTRGIRDTTGTTSETSTSTPGEG